MKRKLLRVWAVGAALLALLLLFPTTAFAQLPLPPSGLSATAINGHQVNLTWVNNATNAVSLQVVRALDAAFLNARFTFPLLPPATAAFSDVTVAENTTYFYMVQAINLIGDGNSNVVQVTTPITNAPAGPSLLVATAIGPNQVNLTWVDNSTTETGFRIERSPTDTFLTIAATFTVATNITTFSDTTVTPSTAFFYRAFAFNLIGNSAASNVATATTPALTVPVGPTNLSAKAANSNQVDLTWRDQSNNESSFRIQRAPTNAFATVTEFSVPGNGTTGATVTFSDVSVTASSLFVYRVFAVNAAGTSPASNVQQVTTPAPAGVPAAPTTLAATAASATQVNLTWVDNANNETGFRIERATDVGFTAGLVTQTAALNATAFNDTTATANTTFSYRVFAVNLLGSSLASNVVTVTTPAAAGAPAVPAAPTTLAATTLGATQVNLTWTDNSNNETGFRIERASDVGFTVGLVSQTVAANVAALADTTVTASSTFSYRVFAVNAAGSSAASNVVTVTTPVAPPPAPGTPAAPTGLAATVVNANQVNLTWTDNSNNETGFRLERATDAGFTVALTTMFPVANATTFSDMSAAASTSYSYRVFSVNGAVSSTASNTASIATPAPAVIAAPPGGGGGFVAPPPPPAAGGGVTPGFTAVVNLTGLSATPGLNVDATGSVQAASRVKNARGDVTIDISPGTMMLAGDGKALGSLSLAEVTSPPLTTGQTAAVLVYEFGPNGATFAPELSITMAYGALKLPVELQERTLTVAYWDGTTWVKLDSAVDTVAKTVNAKVSHFTKLGLLGEVLVIAPTPTPSAAPAPKPTAPPASTVAPAPAPSSAPTPSAVPAPSPSPAPPASTSPVTQSQGGGMYWLVVGIIAAAVILGVVLIVARKRKA